MPEKSRGDDSPPALGPRVCRVRGRVGLYRVVKVFARTARVIALDHPQVGMIQVKKADLRDLGDPSAERSLFPEPADDDTTCPPTLIAEREVVDPEALPPLPYGVLDLDPVVVTDKGPPFRVKCFLRDCREMLRPPTREFKGDVCRIHGIRTHLSGNSPTFTYRLAHRNLITAHRLFSTKLKGHKFKFETHRFGYERSEDCLSWNVFRSLQEAGCLKDVLRFITGLEIHDEPQLYLWGLSMADDALKPWPLLLKARERFESRLPVRRPGTEPDISLLIPGKCLALIEAKFTSPNTFYAAGHRRNAQSLTKDELIEIYQDPALHILDVDKAREADRIYYQLWRNLIFSEWMARQDSPTTLAFHANLVRAGYEHDSASHFRQMIRPDFADRFTRLTWEQLYTLAGLRWRKLARLIEYMASKTVNLVPAFSLDLW